MPPHVDETREETFETNDDYDGEVIRNVYNRNRRNNEQVEFMDGFGMRLYQISRGQKRGQNYSKVRLKFPRGREARRKMDFLNGIIVQPHQHPSDEADTGSV